MLLLIFILDLFQIVDALIFNVTKNRICFHRSDLMINNNWENVSVFSNSLLSDLVCLRLRQSSASIGEWWECCRQCVPLSQWGTSYTLKAGAKNSYTLQAKYVYNWCEVLHLCNVKIEFLFYFYFSGQLPLKQHNYTFFLLNSSEYNWHHVLKLTVSFHITHNGFMVTQSNNEHKYRIHLERHMHLFQVFNSYMHLPSKSELILFNPICNMVDQDWTNLPSYRILLQRTGQLETLEITPFHFKYHNIIHKTIVKEFEFRKTLK